jgi:hypothetical protein
LLVFGRQLLGMIYSTVQREQGQRIETNDELVKLMTRERAVKYARAQRIKWWRHLNRMEKQKQ